MTPPRPLVEIERDLAACPWFLERIPVGFAFHPAEETTGIVRAVRLYGAVVGPCRGADTEAREWLAHGRLPDLTTSGALLLPLLLELRGWGGLTLECYRDNAAGEPRWRWAHETVHVSAKAANGDQEHRSFQLCHPILGGLLAECLLRATVSADELAAKYPGVARVVYDRTGRRRE